MVHIFMLQSQIYMYVPLQILSDLTIRQKYKLYHCLVLMTLADMSMCYGKKKKRRTRAIYKVINNLFFLYINLYKDNITYVCDSNFLYRILLIFNMALKGTVAYSYTISLINLQFLSYVSEHTALSNLRPFINF